MNTQENNNTPLEKIIETSEHNKIRLHATNIAQTVGYALSIVVLILEIIFSKSSLQLGFCCLGVCFAIGSVEKWLVYFSEKQKNDLFMALAETAALIVSAVFVVLAVI